ncbi:cell division protein FtsW [Klenkia soli]|uniref:Probable peptidoglycan glycosyltransferase FtsW n=1 Tax=Klenkia soli TaxID=1052260 RepID=A0A1H0M826_9ACTN|nr:putative lipid II flippase FtsW [Klenkia soli]SDO76507.1 cell division protein FtsW [Klenkia soli]
MAATHTGTERPTRPARTATSERAAQRGALASRAPLFRAPAWLDGPMTSAHLVLGSAGLLLAIGLVMVFSASSVKAAIAGQPAWGPGLQQLVFALLGIGAMLVAVRLPVGHVRRYSGVALLVVAFLLVVVLVPGIGSELNGARQWFDLGVVNLQPSELSKLVLALWGAHVIALRERWLTTKSLLVPVLPVFGVLSLLLIREPDFGAVMIHALVVAGLLWAGGIRGRHIGIAAGVVAVLVVVMVQLAPYRLARVTSFLHPFDDPMGDGLQAIRGFYALASGGLTGVGLGNSAMKWNLLPHASSDYIFAIIGEELGFLGCLVVIALYGVLAYAGFRIARRSTDRFIQLASTAITVWLIGQAFINMGYVVGLLPVTGVTLPLISAGGTSLVLTLFIVGLLVRFARAEPAAIEHLRAHRRAHPVGALGRLGRWLVPVPEHAVAPLPTLGRRSAPPADGRGARRTGGRTVARVRDGARAGAGRPDPARRDPARRDPERDPRRDAARSADRGARTASRERVGSVVGEPLRTPRDRPRRPR